MKLLLTGGAGFIGGNAAAAFLSRGDEVILFDNLQRLGSEDNLRWVREQGAVHFVQGDVRDRRQLDQVLAAHPDLDAVLHLAGQVAVTHSIADPQLDFEVNAGGTLNVLEAVRAAGGRPAVLFSSTNKVYGALSHLPCAVVGDRYVWTAAAPASPGPPGPAHGIDETQPLDFHSPYGCSKGAADQYVRDYARIYGLRTVVLRQSCIYGPRQFGIEDQGWLAWLALCALARRPVTLFGDGRQVRDLLHVTDLLQLFMCCLERIDLLAGQVLNVGGGPANARSVLEVLTLLEQELGTPITRREAAWRAGDQKIFIADTRTAERLLGWRPQIGIQDGLRDLIGWLGPQQEMIFSRLAQR